MKYEETMKHVIQTLKGLNLNSSGCQPGENKCNGPRTLKGLNNTSIHNSTPSELMVLMSPPPPWVAPRAIEIEAFQASASLLCHSPESSGMKSWHLPMKDKPT